MNCVHVADRVYMEEKGTTVELYWDNGFNRQDYASLDLTDILRVHLWLEEIIFNWKREEL
jgi:hypothetical protein